MSMLEVRNVHKSFEGVEILKGIDLTVDKGDVVAILGPSGSGKTTFLRCINFLERADAGEMVFDGETFDLAAVRRRDDNEDKLVAAPEDQRFTPEEIREAIHFVEQYFDSTLEVWQEEEIC